MSQRPKISVLIPTYNYARYLAEALDSVRAQDTQDFELLVSDDASTDASADIIAEYAKRDPRIRFHIHPKNIGMVANWNWCLAQAKGEYVKFLFGDDCLLSHRTLSHMAQMLDDEPKAVLAATARLILDEKSKTTDKWDELGAAGYHEGGDVITACFKRDRNLVGEPSVVMFRRSAAARGFDPSFRQLVDQEMWFHLLSTGGLVYELDPMCAFRCHAHQQTVANQRDQVSSAEAMRLVARYFPHFASSVDLKPNSFAMRRRLFRHIYYSRKNSRRSPSIQEAEAELLPRIAQPWYSICWVLHRTMKPLENFFRFWRRKPKPVIPKDNAGKIGPAAEPAPVRTRPAA